MHKSKNGGESVSQPPLKDKAFSTFLGQNPPFELRPEMGFRRRQKRVQPMARHRQLRHQATSERQIAVAPLSLIAVRLLGIPGCSYYCDHVGNLEHLYARRTTFAVVSRATAVEVERVKSRLG